MSKVQRMCHCFVCGDEIGFNALRLDTCAKMECQYEARDAHEQEREEAHEQLDRDMGWL